MTEKLKTTLWTLEGSLKTEEDIAHYLDTVIEDGDSELLLHAIGVIAKNAG